MQYSRKGRALTDKEIAGARELHDNFGLSYTRVAKRLGTTYDTVRRALDPAYRRKRNRRINEVRRQHTREMAGHERRIAPNGRVNPDDVAARLAEIPTEDTRSLTSQILGDPLPGRSALDMERR